MTHYLKQCGKMGILFFTHIFQKTGISTRFLGNTHIAKHSYLIQLNTVIETMQILHKNCY